MQDQKFYKSEDSKNKKIFFAIIAIFLVAVIAIVIIYFATRSNEHTGEIGNQVQPNAYFVNRKDLNQAIDTYPATDILTNIEALTLDEYEISTAPSENNSTTENYITYTVTIKNVTKLPLDPDITYSVDFNLSDDRVYQSIIREDSSWGMEYVCSIITRKDTKTSWLFINTNDSSNELICKNWGKEKNLTFKEIKTLPLSVIE